MLYYLKVLQIFLAIFLIIGIMLQYTRSDILSNASINKQKEVIDHNLLENSLSKIIILLIVLFIGNTLIISNQTNTKNQNLVNIKYSENDKKD